MGNILRTITRRWCRAPRVGPPWGLSKRIETRFSRVSARVSARRLVRRVYQTHADPGAAGLQLCFGDCHTMELCACPLGQYRAEGALACTACPIPAGCDWPYAECTSADDAVCGLKLVLAPHLARSFHHLFPVPPFEEIAEEVAVGLGGRREAVTDAPGGGNGGNTAVPDAVGSIHLPSSICSDVAESAISLTARSSNL